MKTYLELNEVGRLESAAKCLRDNLLIRVIFHLGCRVSEALGIETKDIDWKTSAVTIQHLKVRLRLGCPVCSAALGRSHSFCPKCGVKVEEAVAREQEHRKIRTLPIDEDTLEMLRDYVKRGGRQTIMINILYIN